MKKIKLGVIGLGLAWERLHAPALEQLTDRFEITAVCDINVAKARQVARGFNLSEDAAYSNYNKLLEHPGLEAALTLLPISQNFDAARAVIRRGLHLVAEKPLAQTPDAAKELIRLKNRLDVKVMVAENIRYEEENKLIKGLIENGTIGNAVYFIDNHVTEYREDAAKGGFAQTKWRQKPEYAGGVLLDSGVHHVARWRYLFGDAQKVFTHGRESGLSFSPFSCINTLATFNDGIAGHYSFFVVGKESQKPAAGLRIFGTHGEIYLEERGCGFVNLSFKDDRPAQAIAYTPGRGYFYEWEDFHAALRLGARLESTPEKALGDIETVFAMLTSARLSEPVAPIHAQKLYEAYIMPRRLREYPQAIYS
jgi:predicted dehydrogenase